MDIAALRACDRVVVAMDKPGSNRVYAIKENRPSERDPFAKDIEYCISAPITVDRWETPDTARCFAYLNNYRNQLTHDSSILALLRAGDGVIFEFCPDYHSNGYIAAAGLHADALTVKVYKGDKMVARYEIDQCCCPDNTARMCRGIPSKDSYYESAKIAA
jgi:hypothetical protein